MSLDGDTRHVKLCSRAKFNEMVLKESYLENLCEFDEIIGVVYGTVNYSGCSKVCRVKMDRRNFMRTVCAGAILAGSSSKLSTASNHKESSMMNLVIAADPFALELKEAVKKHLQEQGYKVIDAGATNTKEVPYYDAAAAACKLLQEGKAERGILFCGTGMGMSIVANKFKGVTASCVESVFAAKMARAINDSNVLTMGAMIVAHWMGKEMVDVWMKTSHTEGLEQFGDFLKDAVKQVDDIDQANRK